MQMMKFNKKGTFVTIIFFLIIITIAGIFLYRYYKAKELNNLRETAIEDFQKKDYNASKNILNEYIKKGGDDEEAKEILQIINLYNDANNFFQEGDYDKSLEKISKMPSIYLRYNIVDDVQNLEKDIYQNKKIEEEFKKRKNDVSLNMYKVGKVTKDTNQFITVVSFDDTRAELILWEKNSNNLWVQKDRMLARLGLNGMKDAKDVYEGDKCTPTGIYSLTRAFGHEENPGTKLNYMVLNGTQYWVDDPNSKYYNTLQFGEANGRWNSAENLSEVGRAYNYVVVINYNMDPVVPGKSSAIFLHVDNGFPTSGCVAVKQDKMVEILKWLNPKDNPKIVLETSYDKLNKY